MKTIMLTLKDVKPLLDDVFTQDEIKTLIKDNSLYFDHEELDELFYEHQGREMAFLEEGPIELSQQVYEYINNYFTKDQSSHVKSYIENIVYKTIFDKYILTIKDLLIKFFELYTLEPNIDNWLEENLKDNDSRFYRLLQLRALFSAFDLEWDIDSFQNGNFLEKEASKMFSFLVEYRKKLTQPFAYLEGVYALPYASTSTINELGNIHNDLYKNIEKIDKLLIKYFTLKNKHVSLEKLVTDFSYPNVNLTTIDYQNL